VSSCRGSVQNESYKGKINNLAETITNIFPEEKIYFKRLKRCDLWGEDKSGNHYGVLFYNEESKDDSSLWILVGISTTNPPDNDPWYLSLLFSQEHIPDVECAIYRWFDNVEELNDFEQQFKIKEQLLKTNSQSANQFAGEKTARA
jgi:hypothetical protein